MNMNSRNTANRCFLITGYNHVPIYIIPLHSFTFKSCSFLLYITLHYNIYIYIPLRMDFHMFSWDYLPISFYIPMKIPNDLPILSTSQRLLGQRLHLRFSPFGALGQLRDHLAGSGGKVKTFTLKIQQRPFKNIQRIQSILLSSSKSRMQRKGTPPTEKPVAVVAVDQVKDYALLNII